MVEQLDIVVVGAGPAGLSAAGALAHRGRRAVVLERDDRVGARWESRYVAPQVLAAQPRGLHMIGYRESVRGALFDIGRDSRALARSIDEELEVPCRTLG